MTETPRRWPRWKRILYIYVAPLTVFAVAVWIVYPVWLEREIAANERSAATALSTLAAAEADFRSNDRDGNTVADFWTADVVGLYRFGRVERAVALADARPLSPLAPKPIAFHGYYFMALDADASVVPPEDYRRDTDKTSGKVHHPTKFGFVAYPAEPGRTGRFIFIVSEDYSVPRADVQSVPVPKNWPSDQELKNSWGRCSGG